MCAIPINLFDLFLDDGAKLSKLLSTIQYFVDNIALTSLDDLSKHFDIVSEDLFTPKETEEFNRYKKLNCMSISY